MEKITDIDNEYESLYKNYFKKFYNYGRKFTKDIVLIEDSIQEVFLDLWNKRQKSVEIKSPNSYYFSSFRFILFRKIKQATRLPHFSEIEEEPEFSIEQKIIAGEISEELHQRLQAALQTLTSRQREAIFFRFYEGLSYEEVAEILNITVKATYKIMARSLESLKSKLSLSVLNIILLLYVSRL